MVDLPNYPDEAERAAARERLRDPNRDQRQSERDERIRAEGWISEGGRYVDAVVLDEKRRRETPPDAGRVERAFQAIGRALAVIVLVVLPASLAVGFFFGVADDIAKGLLTVLGVLLVVVGGVLYVLVKLHSE